MNKILVIRLGVIGDLVLTSPAIINLRLSYPHAQISLLTRRNLAAMAENLPGLDDVLGFPMKASFRNLYLMGEYLDKLNFDAVIDLHGNLRSKYLKQHIAASVRVQYPKRRFQRFAAVKWHKIIENAPHTIDLYNEAVKQAGGEIHAFRPSLHLPSNESRMLDFANKDPVMAFAPGASYPPKQWPLERYSNLIMKCHKNFSANIVLIMTEKESQLEAIRDEITDDKLKIFKDADLMDAARVLSESDVLVCNDSGLMHLASAVGTPVTALFGPTHPTLGFWPRGINDVVLQVEEYCRPCSLHGRRPCFRDRQYCFERISVEDVLNRVEENLKTGAKGERALFIDRDGTLIVDKDYLKNPDEVEPEAGSVEALKLANRAGFKIIVISNQSGVARGFFDERKVIETNQRIINIFRREGAVIDDVFYCPHLKGAENREYAVACTCRKPSPGMIEEACRKHNINPFRSYIIGDKISDTQLAYVTGSKGILVRTGYGQKSEEKLGLFHSLQPDAVMDNLLEAVKYIKARLVV